MGRSPLAGGCHRRGPGGGASRQHRPDRAARGPGQVVAAAARGARVALLRRPHRGRHGCGSGHLRGDGQVARPRRADAPAQPAVRRSVSGSTWTRGPQHADDQGAGHARLGAQPRRHLGGGEVIARSGSAGVVTLVLVLAAGCGSDAGKASPTSTTSAASIRAANFPIATFAAISDDQVTEESAAKFQAALALHDVTGGGGMSATVMTAEGTWSGTTGKADGVRDLQVDDQFSIASITKSVVAAQVMLMVETGELALDDLAVDHLPPDLQFDANDATVRHLLSHRSGIPDYYDLLDESQQTDFQRVWTPTEILELL